LLGGLFERLQFRNILRHLFLLGSKLLLRFGKLLEFLLGGCKLFLLCNQVLYAASHVNEVLHHSIKLLCHFRGCRGCGGRCCCLCDSLRMRN